MIQPLHTLSCFNHISAITPITAGLSSQCYQVSADNKRFFAKQVTTTNETLVSLHAASLGISPQIIYHDKHWLVTQYIDGENLTQSQYTIDDKILIAIKLMAQCHQIAEKPVELAPKAIAHELINNAQFSNLQQAELLRVVNQLTPKLKHTNNLVCCHGDINFSNIVMNQEKKPYLVDFECACIAPVEYDLAMFIAVNNLAEDKATIIIEQYEHQPCSITVDRNLLQKYLTFSYFINSLWYTNAYQKQNNIALLNMYKQQWKKFISSSAKRYTFNEHIAKPL